MMDQWIALVSALGVGGLLVKVFDWLKSRSDQRAARADRIDDKELQKIDSLSDEVKGMQREISELKERNKELETALTLAVDFIEKMYPESSSVLDGVKKIISDGRA